MFNVTAVFFIGCLLVVFSLALSVPYLIVRNSAYRRGIRTWICVFYFEIFILLFIPNVNVPALGAHNGPGFLYLVGFVTQLRELAMDVLHGRHFDFLLLLLIPLVPAVLVQNTDYSDWDGQPPAQ